jgi:MoxR-like ATPase
MTLQDQAFCLNTVFLHKREKLMTQDMEAAQKLGKAREQLEEGMSKVIVGQKEVIEQLVIGLFCSQHALMVGVPGLAKTLIVSTLSRLLGLGFKRIQFTPDLMPSDITGTDIIQEDPDTGRRVFEFSPGPLFSNLILADEINRTPPKTQAALLEAMQERQVSAGRTTYTLNKPFFVLATQNPIEQEGTYPLPEAQLDRFMLNILVDYPARHEEEEILKSTTVEQNIELDPLLKAEDILELQKVVRRVPVGDHVFQYSLDLVRKTRPAGENTPQYVKDWVDWGAGPRAGQNLILGAKARSLMHGRFYVNCEDIEHMALPVMRHRIGTNFNAEAEGVSADDIISRIMRDTPKPSEQ